MRKPKRPRGRPKGSGAKPEGERFKQWGIRFPPEELEAFRAAVPARERAEFARAAIREKLRREGEAA